MKTISVINLKGGVGKTTTAANMAAILARVYAKRVALIDCDPQANLSSFFGHGDELFTVANLLNGDCTAKMAIRVTGIPHVGIIPSNMTLVMQDISAMLNPKGGAVLTRLSDACKDLAEMGYDYTIIDCPPSFSAATVAAIYVSTEVLIPVKLDAFSMSGVRELMYQIRSLRTIRENIGYGILVTMWHNVEVVREGMKAFLEHYGDRVFRTYIRRTDKVDESTYARQTLDVYSPTSAAGRDYRAFVAEYLEGAGNV